jgi:hypothetical protein
VNEAEQRLAAYLNDHGYSWKHEPDYQAELDNDDATRAAKATMGLVEGIHLHDPDRDPEARNELVLWTLRRLAAGDSS